MSQKFLIPEGKPYRVLIQDLSTKLTLCLFFPTKDQARAVLNAILGADEHYTPAFYISTAVGEFYSRGPAFDFHLEKFSGFEESTP